MTEEMPLKIKVKKEKITKNALGLYENSNGWMKGQPKKQTAVGYCHNKKHKGYLSANMIRQHECLGKQCAFFEKYADKPYWEEREKKKKMKKAKKNGTT